MLVSRQSLNNRGAALSANDIKTLFQSCHCGVVMGEVLSGEVSSQADAEIRAYMQNHGFLVLRVDGGFEFSAKGQTRLMPERGRLSFAVIDVENTGLIDEVIFNLGKLFGRSVLLFSWVSDERKVRFVGSLATAEGGLGQTLIDDQMQCEQSAQALYYLQALIEGALPFTMVQNPQTINGMRGLTLLAQRVQGKLNGS